MAKTRLDNYLVDNGHYETRSRAVSAIKAGKVTIDGKVETKAARKISPWSKIEAAAEHPWVSRSGMKLAHALEVFDVDASGRICLDVGASTGGFTEVLISQGASKIYAVDVGREQLHERLQNHSKVISMESTDARDLTAEMLDPLPSFIVCDASFISAMKVLGVSLSLCQAGTDLVSLVKPQFEVGRVNIGRGGLVKDDAMARWALVVVCAWAEGEGWEILKTADSPIHGGDGNREFLLHARKR